MIDTPEIEPGQIDYGPEEFYVPPIDPIDIDEPRDVERNDRYPLSVCTFTPHSAEDRKVSRTPYYMHGDSDAQAWLYAINAVRRISVLVASRG